MSEKLEAWRKQQRRQAALDLREVAKTPAGKRFLARHLLKIGTYSTVASKRDAAQRDVGLALERDVLRACGERVWMELQHIRLTELAVPAAELVHTAGDSDDS